MSKIAQFHQLQVASLSSLGINARVQLAEKAQKDGQPVVPPAPDEPRTVWYKSREGVGVSAKLNVGSYVLPDSSGWAELARLADAAAPAVIKAYEDHLSALAFRVWRKWPTFTGYSRSRLTLRYEARGGQVIGVFASEAGYTRFIGSGTVYTRAGSEQKRGRNPWSEFVVGEQAGVVAKVRADIGPSMAAYARGVPLV